MDLSRRTLLAAMGALVLPAPAALAGGAPAFIAAHRRPDGRFDAAVLDTVGNVLFTEALDGRGHSAAVRREPHTAVLFARRPGRFALVLDLTRQERTAVIAPPPDRAFAGHGVFTTDGTRLIATENDFDGERGVLGIYDATDGYRRLGECPTHGIGPHEALLLSDGRTIAVANGGILTHPDFPRQKLNLATMAPSLALIDAETGDLTAIDRLPEEVHQLSIRHMVEAPDGAVWFGAQYEGPRRDRVPLVGTFARDRGLDLLSADPRETARMNQYVGSVGISGDGETVVATGPRGGVYMEWQTATRSLRGVHALTDVAGAAPAAGGFAVTTGEGLFARSDGTETQCSGAFDNHLIAL